MATEATIEYAFDHLRRVHQAWIEDEDYDAILSEWKAHLSDYAEAAVQDAMGEMVLADKFPSVITMLNAVQRAARALVVERESLNKPLPADEHEIDEGGRKRLIAEIRSQFGLREIPDRGPQRDITRGHKHTYDAKAGETPADGIARCPVCSLPKREFTIDVGRYGDTSNVRTMCREGCDHGLVIVEEVPLTVRPCSRCSPDAYQAWLDGAWGAQADRKSKAKSRSRG